MKKRKEKPEKMKGSGLVIEQNKTIFNFSEEIFPIISHEILNNEIIKKYSDVYQNFVKKTETKRSLETDDILVGLSHFHVIFNEFIEYYNKDFDDKLNELRDFYFKTISNGLLPSVSSYTKYISLYNKIFMKSSSDINKKDFMDELLKIIDETGNSIFIKSDEIITKCNELRQLNKISSGKFDKLIELTKHVTITKESLIDFAKEMVSTEYINAKDYEKILGMTREEYVKLSKELFGDCVTFVNKGEIIQTIDNPNYIIDAERGITRMFSERDGDGRDWIRKGQKAEYEKHVYKQSPTANNRADVVPASVISTIIQILIILSAKKPLMEEMPKQDNTNLFRFLKATRLNMLFISILSNTLEDVGFNIKLSNSYVINPV